MRVFKFGGASVKSAEAVRNVAAIIAQYRDDDLWVVVSAMGKTTNALEALLDNPTDIEAFQALKDYHMDILSDLFPFRENETYAEVSGLFKNLESALTALDQFSEEQAYAHIVSFGELISTRIISGFINNQGVDNSWVDARELIMTDERCREAKVDMKLSQQNILKAQKDISERASLLGDEKLLLITQGFIGHSGTHTTTLGREGSDYSGGILAWASDATGLSIWKDVPGMLQADPKYYPQAEIIERLSYKEAIELAYYGASVIHPKTIKPLQNKGIPLYVKSFKDPQAPGTMIQNDEARDRDKPSYIFKQNQVLLSVIPHDFSFIMEENISEIFAQLASYGLKANLIQNSAVSFSICMDDKGKRTSAFRTSLAEDFKVLYNTGLSLLTIRHYDQSIVDELLDEKEILVEQRSRQTARYVVKGGFSPSNA